MALLGSLTTLNAATPILLNPFTNSTSAVSGETRPNWRGTNILIQNVDATAIVYLGGQNVTSVAYGYKLIAGASVNLPFLGINDALWAISSSASSVAVLQQRQ